MYKIIVVGFIFCSIFIRTLAGEAADKWPIKIIPEPVALVHLDGFFEIENSTRILVNDERLFALSEAFSEQLTAASQFRLTVGAGKSTTENNAVLFELNATPNTVLGEEGYRLHVSERRTVISANTPHGVFNGIQSLLQLLPPDIEDEDAPKRASWQIPCVQIEDYPRFGWRGLMLDVSRHFFPKEFIKRYLDQMSKYKLNVFHWHLTDDNGWRIEIKGLPELTDIGAWRVEHTGTWASKAPQSEGEPTYGGYYTQDDIREIVAYANERFITIVPEIDVPAHSFALIAAYPHLSCAKDAYTQNVICVANDSVYTVLDQVFTQVAELFPGEYIHVGGDEANYEFWANDPACRTLMKRENIKSLEGLQAYFEQKVEKIVQSKGKKMTCWYGDYLEGLDNETAVYSWQDNKGGIKSSKEGRPVIMTPHLETYLDYAQGVASSEPVNILPATLRLKHCYEFDIVPSGADPLFILGGQGNLWTESVPNERHAEYMTWPRSMALAEVFWSVEERDWPDFLARVEHRLHYLDAAAVSYASSFKNPIVMGVKKDDEWHVKLDAEVPGVELFYTFDGTNPDRFSLKYTGVPLEVPTGATQIRVVNYRNGKRIGNQINFMLDGLDNGFLR